MPKPPAQSAASRVGVLPLLSHPASRARAEKYAKGAQALARPR